MSRRDPSESVQAQLAALLPRARDPAYWEGLVPGLSTSGIRPDIEDDGNSDGDAVAHERMMREGWCRGGEMLPPHVVADIRRAIEAVRAAGWPTVFAFVYDVLWWPPRLKRLQRFARTVLGVDVKIIPDFWAYYIPISSMAHGYRPHREAAQSALLPDGRPAAITSWLPITDATVDNGCMYVIPRHLELEHFPSSELRRLYHDVIEVHGHLHRARAIPAQAGTVLCWDHMTKHWGGFSSSDATHPRISIAYEWIRADVLSGAHEHTRVWETVRPRAPGLFGLDEPMPTLKQRLYLIGRNMKRYLESQGPDDVFPWMADVFLLGGYSRLSR